MSSEMAVAGGAAQFRSGALDPGSGQSQLLEIVDLRVSFVLGRVRSRQFGA
jgi:hypothetical protein